MRYLIYFFLLCSFAFISCTKRAFISGKFYGNRENIKDVVYLLHANNFDDILASYQSVIIDSAAIDQNGEFSFAYRNNVNKIFYTLALQEDNEKYSNKLVTENPNISNYIPLIAQGDAPIFIEADYSRPYATFEIMNASRHHEALMSLRSQHVKSFNDFLAHLPPISEDNLLEHAEAKEKYINSISLLIRKFEPLIKLVAIRILFPSNDYERNPELVKQYCSEFGHLELMYAKQFCARSTSLPLALGDKMGGFVLPMYNNTNEKIENLLGKKLTLIDLWASWCAPCRKENKNILVPLWDRYHTQGFQIIAYGLESSKESWLNAIEKDGASRWSHASHLLGDDSPLFKSWHISTIPANYLLNADGMIVAKNLHGKALTEFVDKYFNK